MLNAKIKYFVINFLMRLEEIFPIPQTAFDVDIVLFGLANCAQFSATSTTAKQTVTAVGFKP